MSQVRGSRFRVLCAVTAAACALVLTACGGSSTSDEPSANNGTASSGGPASEIPDGPIKIGLIAEQSGSGAAIGNYQVSVQKAIAAYLNEHGGIAGHQVELVIENNQSDPAVAVTAARKMTQEGVAGLVYAGLGGSGLTQVIAILAKAEIPLVTPNPEPEYDNGEKYPYFFSDNPIDPGKVVALAGFAKDRGFDKIGQLGDSTPYAKSLEEHFAAEAKDTGLTVVKTVDYPTTSTNMTTQLSQLKDAGAETLALWCEVGCGAVFDGLRQLNWSPNVLTTEVVYYSGLSSVKSLGSKTFGICPVYKHPGQPVSTEMAEIVKAVAPNAGGFTASDQGIVLNADSWLILKYAIEKANSLDGAKVKAAIETISGKSFSTPDVTYTFTPEHHAGFQAAHPEKIGVCGFDKLSDPLKLPILAKK